jgi:hypothetical protein
MMGLIKWLTLPLRVLRRLPFFPFSLLYASLLAALRARELWLKAAYVRVGEVTGPTAAVPRNAMLWLAHVATGLPGRRFDVCLQVPPDTPDAGLHDLFSTLLTSPRLRSIGLYWDEPCLSDDLLLWQGRREERKPKGQPGLRHDLGSLGFQQLRGVLQSNDEGLTLPVSVSRDAQTLLKRHARGAYAVCLNLPVGVPSLAKAVATALPDLRFFDLALSGSASTGGAANILSLSDYGLNLHERMALAKAADAYVGSFDVPGCSALLSGRPTVLLGGDAGAEGDRISLGHNALWFPGPAPPPALTEAVLQFLRHHFVPGAHPF